MNSNINVFLEEIMTVCVKHGLSIAHEDSQGAFLIKNFDIKYAKWLMEASDRTNEETIKTIDQWLREGLPDQRKYEGD